jgi:hypothetical protein
MLGKAMSWMIRDVQGGVGWRLTCENLPPQGFTHHPLPGPPHPTPPHILGMLPDQQTLRMEGLKRQ